LWKIVPQRDLLVLSLSLCLSVCLSFLDTHQILSRQQRWFWLVLFCFVLSSFHVRLFRSVPSVVWLCCVVFCSSVLEREISFRVVYVPNTINIHTPPQRASGKRVGLCSAMEVDTRVPLTSPRTRNYAERYIWTRHTPPQRTTHTHTHNTHNTHTHTPHTHTPQQHAPHALTHTHALTHNSHAHICQHTRERLARSHSKPHGQTTKTETKRHAPKHIKAKQSQRILTSLVRQLRSDSEKKTSMYGKRCVVCVFCWCVECVCELV